MTQTFAPVLVTVAEAFFIIPANIDVIWIIEEHGEREPHEQRRELALVVDEELVGDAEDSEHALFDAEDVPRGARRSDVFRGVAHGARAMRLDASPSLDSNAVSLVVLFAVEAMPPSPLELCGARVG